MEREKNAYKKLDGGRWGAALENGSDAVEHGYSL